MSDLRKIQVSEAVMQYKLETYYISRKQSEARFQVIQSLNDELYQQNIEKCQKIKSDKKKVVAQVTQEVERSDKMSELEQ